MSVKTVAEITRADAVRDALAPMQQGAGSNPPPNFSGGGYRQPYDFEEPAAPSPLLMYRVATWFLLITVTMIFAGLSAAYIARAMSNVDWSPVKTPVWAWLSTGLMLYSSWTLERGRRALKNGEIGSYRKQLLFTLILGFAFLASQVLAWRALAAQGVFQSAYRALFYLLTAVHGVHLLGGLLALGVLFATARRGGDETQRERRVAAAYSATLYWHFLDGMWIMLFGLLVFWK